jgi:hypothetical protein
LTIRVRKKIVSASPVHQTGSLLKNPEEASWKDSKHPGELFIYI